MKRIKFLCHFERREKSLFGKISLTVFLSLILLSPNINSQIFSDKDVEVCNSKFNLAVDKSLSEKPINEVIIEIGKSFLEN